MTARGRLAAAACAASLVVVPVPPVAAGPFVVEAESGDFVNAYCGDNPPMAVTSELGVVGVFHPGSGCAQRFNFLRPVAFVDSIRYHTGGMEGPICGHFVVTDDTTGVRGATPSLCTPHSVWAVVPVVPPVPQVMAYTITWFVDFPSPDWADAVVDFHTGL